MGKRGRERSDSLTTPPCVYCNGGLWRRGHNSRGSQVYKCRDCGKCQTARGRQVVIGRRQREAGKAARSAQTLAAYVVAVNPELAPAIRVAESYFGSWVTVAEAARRRGVSYERARQLATGGRFETLETGNKVWVWQPTRPQGR